MKEKEFSEQLEQNQGIIWKVCRAYTHTQIDGEDLFQEIVYQLWKSHKGYKGTAKFSTWMYRVALNTAITLFKKKKKRVQEYELQSYHVAGLRDNSEFEEKQERIQQLYAAIKKLSEIERALTLMYLDDCNYTEISEALGISSVNARVKMNRIKKKLRELMTYD